MYHCNICDYCCEKFDHHCPWIGVCVGKKNYFSFFLYILFTAIHMILITAFSIYGIKIAVEVDNNSSKIVFIILLGVIGLAGLCVN
jgi:hypothetical protein